MTPESFREAANRQAAVALLPLRVQVLLAAEWARSILPVLLSQAPDYLRPVHALDTVIRWALAPTDIYAAQVTAFAERDRGRPLHPFGTAPRRAAGAVDATVRAAARATAGRTCAEVVAECGTLVVRGTPATSYALLDARWRWLYTTYRHALGPGLPFDPAWRTSTAVALGRGIVMDRALDLMPVLADALRDAGCGEEPLAHLTGECTLADWTLSNLLGLADPPSN
jgi:hypothetical protein